MALAESGPRRRWGAPAALLLIVASNLPDLDILLSVRGRDTYLFSHGGPTHSLIGIVAGIVLLAAAFRLWSPLKDLRVLAALAATGLLVHLALDLATPWGARLSWPLNPRRVAFGWMAEIDPVVWGILAIGLVAGLVWLGRTVACHRTALVCVVLYAFGGAVSQSLARAHFAVALGTLRVRPARVEAYPQLLRPLAWSVIGWTPDRYFQADVQALSGIHGRLRAWFRMPVPPPVDGEFARGYLDWACVPLVKLQTADGRSVALYDLAYLGRLEGMPYVATLDAGPPGQPPVHAWQGSNIAPPSPDEERELPNP